MMRPTLFQLWMYEAWWNVWCWDTVEQIMTDVFGEEWTER